MNYDLNSGYIYLYTYSCEKENKYFDDKIKLISHSYKIKR